MTYWIRKAVRLTGLTITALVLVACSGVNSGVKPIIAGRPQEELFRTELKKELSFLNINIEVSENELGAILSRVAPQELYNGSANTRGLTALILRNGPITANAAGNHIYLSLPISICLSYGVFKTPAIAVALKFKLNPRVTPDWKINVEVHYTGLSELIAENAGIGLFSIKPRSIVEGIVLPLQRTLSDAINKKINEKFSLKAQASKAWNAAQRPISLDRSHNAWLKITPLEALLYPLHARDGQVKLGVGLKSFAELVVGPEPVAGPHLPLPGLKLANGMDRLFRVSINTSLFYKDILKIASTLLLNKEFGGNGKSVVIKALDLYGNGDRLIIKVATTGDLDGIFYLTCRPAFNPLTNLFSVEDVDFDMQTRDLLLQSAGWFLHNSIKNSIKEKLNMDLTQRLMLARDMAKEAMARVKLAENVFLAGSANTVSLGGVLVQSDKISIQIYTEGEATVVFH